MKKIILLFVALSITIPSFTQKVISGKSKTKRFIFTPEYKRRALPPNLFVNLSFEDANNNGILEASESATLMLDISNKGKGVAQNLLITIDDSYPDFELNISDGKRIPYLYAGKSILVEIPIKAGMNIESAEHKLKISISEHFGYDMDPVFLILNTLEFQEPKLVLSGLELVDIGSGTVALVEDGQLQAGEQVKVKLVIQNIGQNISKETKYHITSSDNNIYIKDAKGFLGDIVIGEVKEFWVSISPNKRVTTDGKLPIKIDLTNFHNRGNIKNKQLPIVLNQKPPAAEIVEVKADIESLTKQVARFEYKSNKITTNISNVIDIRQVSPSKTLRPNAIAVVIGVEDYDNFAPAPYAANDADIIKDYFKNVLGISKVFIYKNNEVSGFFFDNIFNPEYGELQKAIEKNKTELFVFYSGHGMPSKTGASVYLFPNDGRIESLSRNGYNLNQFYKNLTGLRAKSVTLFIDACFSGVSRSSDFFKTKNLVAMKGVAIKPDIMKPWENNSDFTVFSSSGYNETSLCFDPSETGLFTYFLCAGLQGNADLNKDSKITTGELQNYIKNKVIKISTKIQGRQTPQFYGNKNIILSEY